MISKITAYLLFACLSTSALACGLEPKFARPYSLDPPLFGVDRQEYIFYTNPLMQIEFFTDSGKVFPFFTYHWDYGSPVCNREIWKLESGFFLVWPGYASSSANWSDGAGFYFQRIDEAYEIQIISWSGRPTFSAIVDQLPIGHNRMRVALNDFDAVVVNDGIANLIPRAGIDGLPALPGGTLRISVVPEPASWLTMVAGFGLAGGLLRRRQRPAVSAPAA